MQRVSIVICAGLMLGMPLSSLACRELAVFPEHLDVDDAKHYYVVRVEQSEDEHFFAARWSVPSAGHSRPAEM